MKVFARTSLSGGTTVPGYLPFKIFGGRFAVTRKLSPFNDGFGATHIPTGFMVPGITEALAKDVPEATRQRCLQVGKVKFEQAVAKAAKQIIK